ncbi:MAG: 2-oxoacid:acceptor oxidoreductase family protein, partial [Acidobacteria bacterium]|nr:2-oxoacid:acceptor oxidoreductase family protein [Acidobacteriota bacterium]
MASSLLTETVPASSNKKVRYPGILTTTDGSGAVVWVDSHIAQGACAYPITPSTPMGDGFAVEFSNGKKNLWGESIEFLEPESEHSSASACEGYALAGGRVSNFTSGQGLILMKEVLYVISGKRLPAVFHIGARALTSHSLNVHAGHDDVMGVADVGWGMLFGRNAQEAADLGLIARRAAEESETQFMNIQDGFLTTHTLETILLPEPEFMKEFVGAPAEKVRKLFDPKNPVMSGVVQNQDSYMKGKVAQRHFYDRVAPALRNAMQEFTQLTGRAYSFLRAYRMEDAEYAFIGLGSMLETAEATVDYLRGKGMKIGAIHVTSFRPFPARELAELLKNCRAVSVIERCDVPLAESNPLTTEVKAALADAMAAGILARMPEIFSGVAGLGGRDTRPGHFVAAAENMASGAQGKKFFVLGVKHADGIQATLDPDVRPENAYSMRGHSVGGFGSVTTNKVIASVASELFGLYAQAFPKYGSEKKGLPTNYYLTLAGEPIRLHAELNTVDFVAIQDQNAFLSGDPLVGLLPNGIIYLQSNQPADKVWASLPAAARQTIRARKLRLFALDAKRIAKESSSRMDLQVRMQGIVLLGAFLRLAPFGERAGLDEKHLFSSLEKTLNKYFGKRGGQVVADNLSAARRGFSEVAEIVPPAEDVKSEAKKPWTSLAIAGDLMPENFCEHIIGSYARGREMDLEADEYVARSLMPPSSAFHRSFRTLAPEIPAFSFAACVGCMECVNECPDTAILAKVVEPNVLEERLAKIERPELRESVKQSFSTTNKYYELFVKKGETGGLFGIFVDPDKCKGCGECIVACGTHNALKMVPKTHVDLGTYDTAMDLFRHLPDTPAKFINEKALGDMMLAQRSQLFAGGAGSCMGCGEATAVRQMLAATGFQYGAE